MARNMYGATSADFTITSGGRVISGAVLTLWTARTGGTRSPTRSTSTRWPAPRSRPRPTGRSSTTGRTTTRPCTGPTRSGSRVAIRPTDITGDPPVMSIGTVGTGTAAASLTGTSEAPVLNLTLPSAGANGVDTAAIRTPPSRPRRSPTTRSPTTRSPPASPSPWGRPRPPAEGRCGVGRHVLTPITVIRRVGRHVVAGVDRHRRHRALDR